MIEQPVTTNGSVAVAIRVSAQDNLGNTVRSERSIEIDSADYSESSIYYHNLELNNFDVATDKLTYKVGDTANLVINSPFDQNVLITYESGRIYHDEWLMLHKGDNNYAFNITSDLAPSFNFVFSYFYNAQLHIEGVPFSVTDTSKNLTVATSFDKSVYVPNNTAQLSITTKDSSGQGVQSRVLIDVVDNNIFSLRDALASGDVSWYFYSPRIESTNFSASTLGIGSGGGCGGGSGYDVTYVPNKIGNSIYWNTSLVTDENGNLTIPLSLPTTPGALRVLVTATTDSTAINQSESVISVQ